MRKITIKTLAALTAFGAVMAMASTLGGVTPDVLGAEDSPVVSCDTNGVATSYPSVWDATDDRYEVASVTVEGVDDACDGQTVKVTLTDNGGNALSEGTLAIPVSGAVDHTVNLAAGVSSEAVSAVHVNIS
jgi:hypothetical protein